MLPEHARLKRGSDFTQVRRNGRAWRDSLLKLNAASNMLEHPRFGLIVSKRVGNTVVRNRVKRRLREALRTLYLPRLTTGVDVVLIAHPSAAAASFQDLTSSLDGLFRKAGLL